SQPSVIQSTVSDPAGKRTVPAPSTHRLRRGVESSQIQRVLFQQLRRESIGVSFFRSVAAGNSCGLLRWSRGSRRWRGGLGNFLFGRFLGSFSVIDDDFLRRRRWNGRLQSPDLSTKLCELDFLGAREGLHAISKRTSRFFH